MLVNTGRLFNSTYTLLIFILYWKLDLGLQSGTLKELAKQALRNNRTKNVIKSSKACNDQDVWGILTLGPTREVAGDNTYCH